MKEVSDRIGALDGELREIDEALASLLLNIPNIPHDSVHGRWRARQPGGEDIGRTEEIPL